jgi:hypothetical protein
MRTLGLVFSAFSMATVLALAAGAGYLVATGRLDRDNVAKIVAVTYGLDPLAPTEPATEAQAATAKGAEWSTALAVKSQMLDLREGFIEGHRSDLEAERRKLIAEKKQLADEREAFKRQRAEWEEGEKAKGLDEVVQIMAKVSVDEAKKILLEMSDREMDSAVALIRRLPVDRQAKILDACTTGEEVRKRTEILRRIRDGQPPLAALETAP